MRRAPRTIIATGVTTAALGAGLMIAAPGTAAADVGPGDFVSKNGLHCGGQQQITGTIRTGITDFKQFSWIYYNCSDRTLFRKADVKMAPDGECRGIGPGQARVLHVQWGSPFLSSDRYNGSKECTP